MNTSAQFVITQLAPGEFELDIDQDALDHIIDSAKAGRGKIAPDDFEMARSVCNPSICVGCLARPKKTRRIRAHDHQGNRSEETVRWGDDLHGLSM